jgi:hypothetical protein
MCLLPINICGTVRDPFARLIISVLELELTITLISTNDTFLEYNNRFAAEQNPQIGVV